MVPGRADEFAGKSIFSSNFFNHTSIDTSQALQMLRQRHPTQQYLKGSLLVLPTEEAIVSLSFFEDMQYCR